MDDFQRIDGGTQDILCQRSECGGWCVAITHAVRRATIGQFTPPLLAPLVPLDPIALKAETESPAGNYGA